MSAKWRFSWEDSVKVAKSAAPYIAGAIVDAASSGGTLTPKSVLIGILLKIAHQFVKDEPESKCLSSIHKEETTNGKL